VLSLFLWLILYFLEATYEAYFVPIP